MPDKFNSKVLYHTIAGNHKIVSETMDGLLINLNLPIRK